VQYGLSNGGHLLHTVALCKAFGNRGVDKIPLPTSQAQRGVAWSGCKGCGGYRMHPEPDNLNRRPVFTADFSTDYPDGGDLKLESMAVILEDEVFKPSKNRSPIAYLIKKS